MLARIRPAIISYASRSKSHITAIWTDSGFMIKSWMEKDCVRALTLRLN
jgi:hypothetical protein